MATLPSRTIGKMDCGVCGEEMPVRQNGRDTINISCPWCGVSAYCKGGSEAHRIVSGWIRTEAVPVAAKPAPEKPAAPVAAPSPTAQIAKIAKAVKPAFDMGAL